MRSRGACASQGRATSRMPRSVHVWNPLSRTEDPLSDHIRATYFSLRRGMVIFSFGFPLLLWWGGAFLGIPLQDSMSDYYFAERAGRPDSFPLRTWFVGLLFAIGGFLWLY